MPHWFGLVQTSSPELLEGCDGDPVAVRERILEEVPGGVSLRAISWHRGENLAAVTVEGPGAHAFLRQLEAREITELLDPWERRQELYSEGA